MSGEIAVIAGYAARFGERDLNGDIIERGAFQKSLRRKAPIAMLYQHASERPVGRWTQLREDAHGLFARGELILSAQGGRDVHALLQGGAIDGLSIGFQTVRAVKDRTGAGRRILEAELWEVSIVTFPMAPAARITHVGAAQAAVTKSQNLSQNPSQNPHRVQPSRARPAGRTSFSPGDVRPFADALRGAATILAV